MLKINTITATQRAAKQARVASYGTMKPMPSTSHDIAGHPHVIHLGQIIQNQ